MIFPQMLEACTPKANTHMHIRVKEKGEKKRKDMNALHFFHKVNIISMHINFMEIFPVLPLLESLNF